MRVALFRKGWGASRLCLCSFLFACSPDAELPTSLEYIAVEESGLGQPGEFLSSFSSVDLETYQGFLHGPYVGPNNDVWVSLNSLQRFDSAGIAQSPSVSETYTRPDNLGNRVYVQLLAPGTSKTLGALSVSHPAGDSYAMVVGEADSAGTGRFLQRYTVTGGSFQWLYSSIAPNGDIVVAGDLYGTSVDLGGGPRALNAGATSFFVARYNGTTGAHQWSVVYSSNSLVGLRDVETVGAAGDVVVLGSMQYGQATSFAGTTISGGDSFLLKLAGASGAQQWVRSVYAPVGVGSLSVPAGDLAAHSSGDVVLCAPFTGTINLGTGNITATSRGDVLVGRYSSSSGAPVWTRSSNRVSSKRATYCSGDSAGNVLVGSVFESFVDTNGVSIPGEWSISGGPVVSALHPRASVVSSLRGTDGGHVWTRLLQGDALLKGLASTPNGRVVVAGEYRGSLDIGAGVTSIAQGPLGVFVGAFVLPVLCGNGVVDAGEVCDGGSCCSQLCQLASPDQMCRIPQGGCDLAEYCTGSSMACPGDALASAGAVCREAASPCEDDTVCTGSSAACPYRSYVSDVECSTWAEALAGPLPQSPGTIASLVTDSSGGAVFLGRGRGVSLRGGVNLGPGPGSSNAFVGRMDSLGRGVFARYVGASIFPYGVGLGADGNILLGAGEPGGLLVVQKAAFADGALVWEKRVANAARVQPITYFAADGLGSSVVAGNLWSGFPITFDATVLSIPSGSDGYLARLDSTGATQWAKRLSVSGGVRVTAMAVEPASGSIVVGGTFSGSNTIGGQVLNSAGSADVFIAKFTNSGAPVFVKSFGGADADALYELAVHSDGSIAVMVEMRGTLGGSAFVGRMLARLNSSGAFVWQGVPAGIASALSFDSAGNVVAAGRNEMPVQVRFVEKRNSAGVLSWNKETPVSGGIGGYDAVHVDTFGNVLLGGWYSAGPESVYVGANALGLRFGVLTTDQIPFIMRLAEDTLLPRCGNGQVDQNEECDGSACCTSDCKVKDAGTPCRGSGGVCDVAEVCDGQTGLCPADGFVAGGTVCRGSAGTCDSVERCTGSTAACPGDIKLPAGFVCRAAAGSCDVAEACSGSANTCPADGFVSAGTVCRAAAGACDVAETCSGAAAACGADAVMAAGSVCRPSVAGPLDRTETCDGSQTSCPLDDLLDANDYDRDGVSNSAETAAGTNMYLSDSDGDGVTDGAELRHGSNPALASSRTTVREELDLDAGGTHLGVRSSDGSLRYFVKDHLGSTRAVVSSGGTVLGTLRYSVFGESTHDSSPSQSRHKFTGQEAELELGLYNYNARLYDPSLGRFLSADTMGVDPSSPQTLNRYSYANNSPGMVIDPSGHTGINAMGGSSFDKYAVLMAPTVVVRGSAVSDDFSRGWNLNGFARLDNPNEFRVGPPPAASLQSIYDRTAKRLELTLMLGDGPIPTARPGIGGLARAMSMATTRRPSAPVYSLPSTPGRIGEFRAQEQPNSCAVACMRMVIESRTKLNIEEAVLRDIAKNYGFHPARGMTLKGVAQMLTDLGIAAEYNGLAFGQVADRAFLSARYDRPVIASVLPAHAIVVDGADSMHGTIFRLRIRDPARGPGRIEYRFFYDNMYGGEIVYLK